MGQVVNLHEQVQATALQTDHVNQVNVLMALLFMHVLEPSWNIKVTGKKRPDDLCCYGHGSMPGKAAPSFTGYKREE